VRKNKEKKSKFKMHKLVSVIVLLSVITLTFAQWSNQNNGFPNFGSIDCNAPGAACHSSSVVCDSRGNCKQSVSGSSISITPANLLMVVMSVGGYFVMKLFT
jgi:hypothetical protein